MTGEHGLRQGHSGGTGYCTDSEGLHNLYLLLEQRGQVGVRVTDRRRLGVLLPDTGLREPDVSSSSADDQDERSWGKMFAQKEGRRGAH